MVRTEDNIRNKKIMLHLANGNTFAWCARKYGITSTAVRNIYNVILGRRESRISPTEFIGYIGEFERHRKFRALIHLVNGFNERIVNKTLVYDFR